MEGKRVESYQEANLDDTGLADEDMELHSKPGVEGSGTLPVSGGTGSNFAAVFFQRRAFFCDTPTSVALATLNQESHTQVQQSEHSHLLQR